MTVATERLVDQLEELDITNVGLAKLVDVAPSSVQRWTRGTVDPPAMLIRLLDCMILLRRIGVDAMKASEVDE